MYSGKIWLFTKPKELGYFLKNLSIFYEIQESGHYVKKCGDIWENYKNLVISW